MRNYEKRLEAIQRIANSKTAKVVFLDFRNGQYFSEDGQAVDIQNIRADVLIIDDIPDEEKEGEKDASDG